MKKFLSYFVIMALFSGMSLFASCDSSKSKKESAKEDQDFSSSGMIKEIEEMKKAAEKGKPAPQPQPVASQAPQK
jgi:hypothetical protein